MSARTAIDVRAPRGEFMIAFDTTRAKEHGFVGAVKVTIEPAHLALNESTSVALCAHPLYPYLRQYVLANLKNTR